MSLTRLKKLVPPTGPILSLTLVGLLLLSSLLYYKAVKAQRYMEPTIAIAKPRIDFAQKVRRLVTEEFAEAELAGIRVTTNSVLMAETLVFSNKNGEEINAAVLEKLGRVFLGVLEDDELRGRADLVLISAKYLLSPHPPINKEIRRLMQYRAELVLDSLYVVQPRLEQDFSSFFSVTSAPVLFAGQTGWIEFRVVPSERIHIDMIERMGKHIF